MTKIYLVVFRDSKGIYDFVAFTNKRKAIQYQRYWKAYQKNSGTFKGVTFTIVEENINNYDYTKEANEEEIKSLPY